MGFSLRIFIEELERILEDSSLTSAEALGMVEMYIAEQKQYAKDCGAMDS